MGDIIRLPLRTGALHALEPARSADVQSAAPGDWRKKHELLEQQHARLIMRYTRIMQALMDVVISGDAERGLRQLAARIIEEQE
jgi:hypothetical protein